MTGRDAARTAPGEHVLAGFGCVGEPIPLAGGRGTTWRCGDLALKPLDGDPAGVDWAHGALSDPARRTDQVRWSAPVRSTTGELVLDGWTAWSLLAGEHRAGQWAAAITAGESFAAALAELPRPRFLAERTDPWAVADRVAWGEHDLPGLDDHPEVRALRGVLRPVHLPAQIVHGDLTGNVLVADGLPPGVIDPSIYWRPVGYGSAIVIVDALTFQGGTLDLLRAPAEREDLPQLLVRAALFRLITDRIVAPGTPCSPHWRRTVAALTDLVRR